MGGPCPNLVAVLIKKSLIHDIVLYCNLYLTTVEPYSFIHKEVIYLHYFIFYKSTLQYIF